MPHQDGQPARKPRILVVDDAPDVAVTMAMLLQALGCEVFQAHNGRSALEAARQHTPHIVFLDIGLPDMSGYEVADRLRNELGLTQSVIIALSGFDEDEERLARSSFDRHVTKPLTVQALKELLNELTGVGR